MPSDVSQGPFVCSGLLAEWIVECVHGSLMKVDMAAWDAQHLGELLLRTAALGAANENARLDVVPTEAAEGRSFDGAAEPNGDELATTRQSSNHVHVGAKGRREKDAATAPSDSTAPRFLRDTVQGVRCPRDKDAATAPSDSTAPGATPPKRAAGAVGHPRPRAKQSIPPALRRALLTRDRRRCRVPGCTHSTFVDVHHVQPRAEGGRNDASNLLTLCRADHRATHRGELLIDHQQEGPFTFRHADGAAYGNPSTPRLIDAHAKVFSALRANRISAKTLAESSSQNCGAGWRTFALNGATGEVRSCLYLADSKKFGSVDMMSYADIFKQHEMDFFRHAPSPSPHLETCRGCEHIGECRGGFAKAFLVSETKHMSCAWRAHYFPGMNLAPPTEAQLLPLSKLRRKRLPTAEGDRGT